MTLTSSQGARRGARLLAGLAVLGLVAVPSSAAAEDVALDFPAGQACDFALGIEGSGGNRQVREFTDRDGKVVRTISAGTGFDLTLTNLDSGASLDLRSKGAVERTTFDALGNPTVTLTGHNILILFPTDTPPGPSTTLVVGRVVFTVDAAGNFVVGSMTGKQTDLCAALSD